MKIYTKKGDSGETQIYVDKAIRVSKSDTILDCYGTLDELNAHIGLLIAQIDSEFHTQLHTIQNNLFQIGFAISASAKLTEKDVQLLETQIDTMQASMPAQTAFLLPGGTQAAAQTHVCRTVTRRAERQLVSLAQQQPINTLCLHYLNRLSDYLFVMARYLNHLAGVEDIKVS